MPASDPAANGADAFAWWRSSSALGRTRRNLLLLLVVLAGGAWVLTIYQSLSMGAPIGSALRGAASLKGMEGIEGMAMGGMSAAGWSFAGAAVFIGVWAVMMAAMMLPAAAPMILIFASAQTRHDHAAAIPTGIFIAGYLFVWSAIGAVVYGLVQIGAEAASYLGLLDRATWGPLALGATLVVGWALSIRPAQTRLPPSLPFSVGVCGAALARRYAWGISNGGLARRVLSWLLLGTVRRTRCCRNHELDLDAGPYVGGVRRKGVPARPPRFGNQRLYPARSRADGGRLDSLR